MPDRNIRKKRWPRRVALTVALFVAALLVAHGIWSAIESHKLNAQINALHAAGEPILPEDFVPANPNDPDNAVADLIAAISLLQPKGQVWDQFDRLTLALPLRPEEIASIDTIVNRSQPALNRIKSAELQPQRNWPIDASKSANIIEAILPELNGIRALADVLMSEGLLEHQRGDDRAAMEHLNCIMFIAELTDRYPTLVGHLVAIGCRAMAAQRLMEISPDLRIGTRHGDAPPAQVRATIDRLLNDKTIRDGYIWGLQGERMFQLTLVRRILAGQPMSNVPPTSGQPQEGWNPFGTYVGKPFIYHNARVILDYTSKMIPLANEPNWPAAHQKVPADVQGPLPLIFLARLITGSMWRAVEVHFRGVQDQHLAAAALALRWYAVDHDGQLPATLDLLVPKYLPAIPTDVLSANSQPIGYVPRKDDPIIYSVGENGSDEGGSEESSNLKFKTPQNEWEMKDRVVHLTRQPRPAPEPDMDDSNETAPTSAPTSQPQN
jgi:hypothetical protein